MFVAGVALIFVAVLAIPILLTPILGPSASLLSFPVGAAGGALAAAGWLERPRR